MTGYGKSFSRGLEFLTVAALLIASCSQEPHVAAPDASEPAFEDGDGSVATEDDGSGAPADDADGAMVEEGTTPVDDLDPALEEGRGPSACADRICGADRRELPRGSAAQRSSPATVIPEPPRIERVLRHAELASPDCLADCPSGAGPDHACSGDCRGRVTAPSLPAHRTTTDGRLALTGGGRAAISASRLDGLSDSPLVTRGADLHERAFSRERDIDVSGSRLPAGMIARGPTPNRFFCAEDQAPARCGEDDCYDLTLVEEWQAEAGDCPNGWAVCGRLAALPIHVRVRDPKSADALVVEARATGDWTASPAYPANTAEPIPTADGRLLVFRLLGGHPLPAGIGMDYAFVKDDGTTMRGRYSLSYAYSETPCDVRGWFATNAAGAYPSMRPWSTAHYDRRLGKYGLAAYPLRDAYGRAFAEGDLVRGSYPWMDRHGNNVFFSTILPDGTADSGATRHPMSVEHPGLGLATGRTPTGFAVAGSWTHGKIVMLDGVLNNEDYSIDAGDTRRLELYRTASGIPINVRVDGNSNTRAFETPGTRGNAQHMESLENTHAMHLGMRPVSARDVVWTMARGDALQEVVFDDMLDPHVLLFAPMNAAWRMPRELGADEQGSGTRRGFYRDGFSFANGAFTHDPATIELQNAATSPDLAVPTHGSIHGDARIEPVAQGGLEGRGLWLEPDAAARFAFPAGRPLPRASFYLSTFFDSREPLTGGRRLLTLESEAGVTRVIAHPGGLSVHRKLAAEVEIASFPVSAGHPWRADGWHHVGVLFGADRLVTVFVDGDPVGAQRMTKAVELGSGPRVVLGGSDHDFAGARGWYDELRLVLAGDPSQLEGAASIELLCNYARGTMASVAETSARYAAAEQAGAVRQRAASLGLHVAEGRRLRCITDHTADLTVRLPLPEGERSLRTQILEALAGNAQLHAGAPRPDTTGNAFCLSCHDDPGSDARRPDGLSLAALVPSPLPVERDPRTQPGQPYSRWEQTALVSGVIPAGWFTSLHGVAVPEQQLLLDASRPVLDWLLRE
jgi:hypothetical protein